MRLLHAGGLFTNLVRAPKWEGVGERKFPVSERIENRGFSNAAKQHLCVLAPVLRFVRLFVYEKGRVHKHKPPRRKAVSEHSERTLETEGFPRWGVGVCARGGRVGKSASAREARRAERFSRRGSGTCGNTCSSALCIFSFIVLIIPKRLF